MHKWATQFTIKIATGRPCIRILGKHSGGGGVVREEGDKDRGKGMVTVDVLQENSAVSVVIWKRYLGGDGVHDKSNCGIPS